MGWNLPTGADPSFTIRLRGVYRCGPILLEMVPNPQKHLEIADLYEKLSANEDAALQRGSCSPARQIGIVSWLECQRKTKIPSQKKKSLTDSRCYDLRLTYFHQADYGTRAIKLN
jgi:hypothetical protein